MLKGRFLTRSILTTDPPEVGLINTSSADTEVTTPSTGDLVEIIDPKRLVKACPVSSTVCTKGTSLCSRERACVMALPAIVRRPGWLLLIKGTKLVVIVYM